MKNSDSPEGNSFPDEMEINFHVFGALMLNGIA
jgi:hypothetical protein